MYVNIMKIIILNSVPTNDKCIKMNGKRTMSPFTSR